jgi:hypothetical protein
VAKEIEWGAFYGQRGLLAFSCPPGIFDLPATSPKPRFRSSNGHHLDTGDLLIGTAPIVELCRKLTNRPDLHDATVGRWIRDGIIPTGRIPPGNKTIIASKSAITAALEALASTPPQPIQVKAYQRRRRGWRGSSGTAEAPAPLAASPVK